MWSLTSHCFSRASQLQMKQINNQGPGQPRMDEIYHADTVFSARDALSMAQNITEWFLNKQSAQDAFQTHTFENSKIAGSCTNCVRVRCSPGAPAARYSHRSLLLECLVAEGRVTFRGDSPRIPHRQGVDRRLSGMRGCIPHPPWPLFTHEAERWSVARCSKYSHKKKKLRCLISVGGHISWTGSVPRFVIYFGPFWSHHSAESGAPLWLWSVGHCGGICERHGDSPPLRHCELRGLDTAASGPGKNSCSQNKQRSLDRGKPRFEIFSENSTDVWLATGQIHILWLLSLVLTDPWEFSPESKSQEATEVHGCARHALPLSITLCFCQ